MHSSLSVPQPRGDMRSTASLVLTPLGDDSFTYPVALRTRKSDCRKTIPRWALYPPNNFRHALDMH